MFRGVMLKFSEPDDARTPTHRWRLYVFKGDEQVLLRIERDCESNVN